MAHGIVNIIIFGYCLTCAGDWGWGDVDLSLDIEKFPIALGLIVFSYTSQIFLPSLEGNMRDPSKFWCMLKWSHIAAAVFKTLFAYVGFLTFKFKTKDAITDNMPVAIRRFVNMVLVVKAMLSYPLPYFAAVEVLQVNHFNIQLYWNNSSMQSRERVNKVKLSCEVKKSRSKSRLVKKNYR